MDFNLDQITEWLLSNQKRFLEPPTDTRAHKKIKALDRNPCKRLTRAAAVEVDKRLYKRFSVSATSCFFTLLNDSENHTLNHLLNLSQSEFIQPSLATILVKWIELIFSHAKFTDDKKIAKYRAFTKQFSLILDLIQSELQGQDAIGKAALKQILFSLQKIAYTILTQNNARKIHSQVLEFVNRSNFDFFPDAKDMLGRVKDCEQEALIKHIATLWDKSKQMMDRIGKPEFGLINIANQTFTLSFPDQKSITFIRFASPEQNASNPMQIYEAMLQHIEHRKEIHIDLSLMSLSEWENEAKINKQRLNKHNEFPGTVFPWAFDLYSQFAWNQVTKCKLLETCNAREFKALMLDEMTKEKSPSFVIFPLQENNKKIKKAIKRLIDQVQEDFFYSYRTLTRNDMTVFIDITLIYLLEYFCEILKPSTCDTACRAHIDRGMYFMTILYFYALCKSKKHESPEFLGYIDTMIFAPSLLFYQRPPHKNVMTRLLVTLSHMQRQDVIQRIQTRQSFFSKADILIR